MRGALGRLLITGARKVRTLDDTGGMQTVAPNLGEMAHCAGIPRRISVRAPVKARASLGIPPLRLRSVGFMTTLRPVLVITSASVAAGDTSA